MTFELEIEVETQTLDGWAASSGVASVDLLWLDLQGAEPAVLGSGRRVLDTVRAVYAEVSVTEIYAGGWLYPRFRRWLEERGLRLVQEALPWSEGAGNCSSCGADATRRRSRRAPSSQDPARAKAAAGCADYRCVPPGPQHGLDRDRKDR